MNSRRKLLKNTIKELIVALLVFTAFFGVDSVEERNPFPFFHLPSKISKIKINIKNHKLCRVKLKEVILNKNIEITDCYEIDKKFFHTVKLIHEKNNSKNELNLMFVDENKKIIHPEIQVGNENYKVKSILYLKKDNSHHIELLDKNEGYYYFTYDPTHISIGE